MSAALSSTLYVWVLLSALLSAYLLQGQPRPRGRRPWATLSALAVVAVPSLLQLTVAPGLLDLLQRDRTAITHGEGWRLVSSLVVQDGGWPGTVVNLAALALVGSAAEHLLGARRWLVVALAAGVGGQLWGLVVQPVGGGNSVVNFGLAAALAVAAVRGGGRARLLGVISLVLALVLLVTGDVHGGAAAIGALTAILLLSRR